MGLAPFDSANSIEFPHLLGAHVARGTGATTRRNSCYDRPPDAQEPNNLMDPSERDKLFDRILMENARLIHNMAWRHAGAALARDLEQEILLALWKSLDRYEGRSSLTTWVYGVALNTARYFNRTNRRPETMVGLMDPEAATTANHGGQRDPDEILKEFAGSLETLDRVIFFMYLDRLSYREMSEILGTNEAALRMRVSRLKQRFTSTYLGTRK